MELEIIKPADGSRVVRDIGHTVLFGQPPEVLKGLLLKQVHNIDTLVLIDTREQGQAAWRQTQSGGRCR